MRIRLPETIELRRNPSALAIATNSRTASGSRLQFTLFLFTKFTPRHRRLRRWLPSDRFVRPRPVNRQALLRSESTLTLSARVGSTWFREGLRSAVREMRDRRLSLLEAKRGPARSAMEKRLHLEEDAMEIWVGHKWPPTAVCNGHTPP